MPSVIDPAMATPGQPLPPMMGNRGFNIGHQNVGLDVDFANKRLKGWTEITIHPTDPMLKQIRLNSRQCRVVKCTVNTKQVTQTKYEDPYANFTIHESATVHQHHMLRKKLDGVLHDPPEHELVISLPPNVRIEPADSFNLVAQNTSVSRTLASQRATPDAGVPATPALMTSRLENMFTPYAPLQLRIEYEIDDIRDGFTFVGCELGDMRYPHAYTTNSPVPGAACCLFPTLDGIHERWTWEIEVTIPRTVGDIHKSAATHEREVNGVNGSHDNSEDSEMDEDGDLDMVVVCSADQIDEDTHPTQPWKKVVKFAQSQAVAPQHISIAVGPFEQVSLSEYRDVENEEAMGTMSVDVLGYCLPGREAELKNTCMFMPKAIDFLVKEFGQYVFSTFKLCFVDDLATDTVKSASLAICSNRLLFPEIIIDTIWPVTKALTYALTTQWAGVQVVPKDWADIWVIVGISYWMTGCFLRNLMGNNEYRFRLKKDAEKICELDVGRPSMYAQGFQVPIDPAGLDFIKLKAPVVLTILEKRLWKLSSSMVLHRVVRKTFLSAVAGELKNGLMSTAHFIRLCEKNSHNKLEPFFQQWVYGSGYPSFAVSQRFNKKRMIVEMGIRQTQATQTMDRPLTPEEFLKDALGHQRHVVVGPVQPVFTGPMTIRIHEADGTPYEHVVDIKEGYTKLEVPYNTKYKRLKRSRRQKQRAAAGVGVDISIDTEQNDDVLLYCLGDVLQSEEEVDDWRLVDWTKDDEEKMAQESFEWIRMDADFEWICTLKINQPDYMFLSQLQQDRDVIAQYDSIRHFATKPESALISSILVRTLMDRRYYYGIRVEAALVLARCATADLNWVGQFHLMKAFQEFFCFPGSPIPRGSDFSDFTAYYVQNAIPQAMSRIRNLSGVCPSSVQRWLLDVLRYNDNSNNNFDDCYYVANLMTALANTLTCTQKRPLGEFDFNMEFEDTEAVQAQESAIKEIERYQRMDQWQPTYRNVVSEAALNIRRDFAKSGVQPVDLKVFMPYTREGTLDTLRVKAYDCLVDLGALEHPAMLRYISSVMGSDSSAYVRRHVQTAFGRGLGMIAMGKKQADNGPANGPERSSLLIMEGAGADSSDARKDELAKGTVEGAVAHLKQELRGREAMKVSLWNAIRSRRLGLIELRYLLDICTLIYEPKTSMIVVMKRPKHLSVKNMGKGKLSFRWAYKELDPKPTLPTPTTPPAPPVAAPPKPKIRLITNPRGSAPPPNLPNGNSKKPRESPRPPMRRTPSMQSPAHASMPPPPTPPVVTTPITPGPPRQKIILKIGKHHLQQQNIQQNGTS